MIVPSAVAADWPSFRNNGRLVFETAEGELPTAWSDEKNIAWRITPGGYGQSSPVVVGSTCYLTAIDGPNKEEVLVHAIDVADGATRWTRRFGAASTAPADFMHSRAAPTPVADEEGVCAFFEGGDLVALDPAGQTRWRHDLNERFGPFVNNHGLGGSLTQNADKVFLLLDHKGPSASLIVFSKTDGTIAWRTEREPRMSFASPMVATLGGVEQVLASSGGTVEGYDEATGKLLWQYKDITGNSIPAPFIVGDRIYLGAKPGRLNPDLNATRRSNCCLEVSRSPEGWSADLVWEGGKALSNYVGPFVVGGTVLYQNDAVVFAVDAEDGGLIARSRIAQPCWVSPVAAGGRIFFFGKGGVTTVATLGDDGRLEVENKNALWVAAEEPSASSDADTARPLGESGHSHAGHSHAGNRFAQGHAPQTCGDPASHGGHATAGGPPGGEGGPPRVTPSEYDDPSVYGVAVSGNTFLIRTGRELLAIRNVSAAGSPDADGVAAR